MNPQMLFPALNCSLREHAAAVAVVCITLSGKRPRPVLTPDPAARCLCMVAAAAGRFQCRASARLYAALLLFSDAAGEGVGAPPRSTIPVLTVDCEGGGGNARATHHQYIILIQGYSKFTQGGYRCIGYVMVAHLLRPGLGKVCPLVFTHKHKIYQ
jgi:hypothetical protein